MPTRNTLAIIRLIPEVFHDDSVARYVLVAGYNPVKDSPELMQAVFCITMRGSLGQIVENTGELPFRYTALVAEGAARQTSTSSSRSYKMRYAH